MFRFRSLIQSAKCTGGLPCTPLLVLPPLNVQRTFSCTRPSQRRVCTMCVHMCACVRVRVRVRVSGNEKPPTWHKHLLVTLATTAPESHVQKSVPRSLALSLSLLLLLHPFVSVRHIDPIPPVPKWLTPPQLFGTAILKGWGSTIRDPV